MPTPSVYSYLEYRPFLRDWFEARKAAQPTYSYGTFAREGKCSRSALANVIGGARTPRAATLDAFARAMGLSPDERNFLGLLVDLESAETMEARAAIMDRLLNRSQSAQVRRAEEQPAEHIERYLRRWYIQGVRELATLPGFRADPAWIATTMRPAITLDEAREALQTLVDLDFLRVHDDGTAEAREVSFRTRPLVTKAAVDRFYKQEVTWLLENYDASPPDERHLITMTMALPVDFVPEAKARLQAFCDQLGNIADDRTGDVARRVYQFSVQLLPLSEAVGGPQDQGDGSDEG